MGATFEFQLPRSCAHEPRQLLYGHPGAPTGSIRRLRAHSSLQTTKQHQLQVPPENNQNGCSRKICSRISLAVKLVHNHLRSRITVPHTGPCVPRPAVLRTKTFRRASSASAWSVHRSRARSGEEAHLAAERRDEAVATWSAGLLSNDGARWHTSRLVGVGSSTTISPSMSSGIAALSAAKLS